jgi:hypothetical protein
VGKADGHVSNFKPLVCTNAFLSALQDIALLLLRIYNAHAHGMLGAGQEDVYIGKLMAATSGAGAARRRSTSPDHQLATPQQIAKLINEGEAPVAMNSYAADADARDDSDTQCAARTGDTDPDTPTADMAQPVQQRPTEVSLFGTLTLPEAVDLSSMMAPRNASGASGAQRQLTPAGSTPHAGAVRVAVAPKRSLSPRRTATQRLRSGLSSLLRRSTSRSASRAPTDSELVSTLTLPDAASATSMHVQLSSTQAAAPSAEQGTAVDYEASDGGEHGDEGHESEEAGSRAPRATIHGNPMYFGTNSEMAPKAEGDLFAAAVEAAADSKRAQAAEASPSLLSALPAEEGRGARAADCDACDQQKERSGTQRDQQAIRRSKSAWPAGEAKKSERLALFETLTMPRNFQLTPAVEALAAGGARDSTTANEEPDAEAPCAGSLNNNGASGDGGQQGAGAGSGGGQDAAEGGYDDDEEGGTQAAFFRAKAATTSHGNPMYFGSEVCDGGDAFAPAPATSLAGHKPVVELVSLNTGKSLTAGHSLVSGKSAVAMVSLGSLSPKIATARSGGLQVASSHSGAAEAPTGSAPHARFAAGQPREGTDHAVHETAGAQGAEHTEQQEQDFEVDGEQSALSVAQQLEQNRLRVLAALAHLRAVLQREAFRRSAARSSSLDAETAAEAADDGAAGSSVPGEQRAQRDALVEKLLTYTERLERLLRSAENALSPASAALEGGEGGSDGTAAPGVTSLTQPMSGEWYGPMRTTAAQAFGASATHAGCAPGALMGTSMAPSPCQMLMRPNNLFETVTCSQSAAAGMNRTQPRGTSAPPAVSSCAAELAAVPAPAQMPIVMYQAVAAQQVQVPGGHDKLASKGDASAMSGCERSPRIGAEWRSSAASKQSSQSPVAGSTADLEQLYKLAGSGLTSPSKAGVHFVVWALRGCAPAAMA